MKLFWLSMVMVDVIVEPDLKLTDEVALIVKSGETPLNVKIAVTEWVSDLLVAVTVTM